MSLFATFFGPTVSMAPELTYPDPGVLLKDPGAQPELTCTLILSQPALTSLISPIFP